MSGEQPSGDGHQYRRAISRVTAEWGQLDMPLELCDDGVMAHARSQSGNSGSIPASSLHFWFNETDAATDLVEQFHYSRRWPSNVQLVVTAHTDGGLFGNKGPAVAACVISIPGTRWSEEVWELSRLVRRDDIRTPLSSLIAATVRKLKAMPSPAVLVSFADNTQSHHGGIYQASGWTFDGLRKPSVDGLTIDGQFVPGRSANSRYGTRSAAKLALQGITATDHSDDGKYCYWKAWRDGIARAGRLGLKSQPYPKPNRP